MSRAGMVRPAGGEWMLTRIDDSFDFLAIENADRERGEAAALRAGEGSSYSRKSCSSGARVMRLARWRWRARSGLRLSRKTKARISATAR